MPVRVINIPKEHESVLYFLFPTYSMSKSVDECIFSEDIKSQERVDYYKKSMRDAVIVSRVLYDEMWDEQKIADEALSFRRRYFGCRKKTLKLSHDNLVDEVRDFILLGKSPEDDKADGGMMDLFSSFGTRDFPYRFFDLTKSVSVQTVIRSVLTFMTKVMVSDNPFYSKFNRAYSRKMRENLPMALEFYSWVDKDQYGLYFVRFCQMLTS